MELVAQLVLPAMQQAAAQHAQSQAASAPGAVTAGAHSMPAAGSYRALNNLHCALENTCGLVFCAAGTSAHAWAKHAPVIWPRECTFLRAGVRAHMCGGCPSDVLHNLPCNCIRL